MHHRSSGALFDRETTAGYRRPLGPPRRSVNDPFLVAAIRFQENAINESNWRARKMVGSLPAPHRKRFARLVFLTLRLIFTGLMRLRRPALIKRPKEFPYGNHSEEAKAIRKGAEL